MASQGEGVDEGPLSGLSRPERRRLLRAMTWGRPLPPRLARAAVQYAPKLLKDAWRGWLFLGIGVAFVGLSIAEADTSRIHWWVPIGYVAVAAGWMWSGT